MRLLGDEGTTSMIRSSFADLHNAREDRVRFEDEPHSCERNGVSRWGCLVSRLEGESVRGGVFVMSARARAYVVT